MLIDGRSVPAGEQIEADICIIGSGPAGVTIARQFAGTATRVAVLESGGKELSRPLQKLNDGESVGRSYFRLRDARSRCFGGSSRRWPLEEGWRARPLDEVDFEARPGLPDSGWPFGRAELDIYYGKAQAVCDLGPYDYDIEDWEYQAGLSRLPLDETTVKSTVFQLGSTHFGRYLGGLERSGNVSVFLHSTVVDIQTQGRTGHVDRVVVRHFDGRVFGVAARIFVLAAGGIENPRLLLASNRCRRAGLGNEHDLVGRFFMERLSVRAGFVVPLTPELLERSGMYEVLRVGGTRIQATVGLNERLIRDRRLLNTTFFMVPRTSAFVSEGVRSFATLVKGLKRRPGPDKPLAHLRNIAGSVDEMTRAALERLSWRDRSPGVLLMRAQAEQAPNPASRVTLNTARDGLGMPRARLDWRPTELDHRSIRQSQAVVDAELRRAGLGRVELPLGTERPAAYYEGNHHHMGTTRMHVDPKRGVVDADGRVHSTDNLYVAGSSVFPSVGCSNPTLTIVALALRLADHLERVLAQAARSALGN